LIGRQITPPSYRTQKLPSISLDVIEEDRGEIPGQGLINRNFLLQKCGECGREVSIEAGDVLEGGRWYHRGCWKPAAGGTI
jgi:hypothetical protein